MDAQRFAAIDIGTVTTRMLVADVCDGQVHALERLYGITNLGEGVDATGLLKPEAIDRVEAKIREYLDVLEGYKRPEQPEVPIIAMATSASRDARNSADFVDRLAGLGITLTVIPGSREASLGFAGASAAFPGKTLLVVDVGGGSTEIIAGRSGEEPLLARSHNIGCRRVTERFLTADPPSVPEMEKADAWIREGFAPYFAELADLGIVPECVVAVAGTATSVVAIDKALVPYDSAQVHGCPVSLQTLVAVRERLAACTLEERRAVAGLDPERAPVIVAGTLILQAVVELAGAEGYVASEADILEGIVLDAWKSAR